MSMIDGGRTKEARDAELAKAREDGYKAAMKALMWWLVDHIEEKEDPRRDEKGTEV